MAGKKHLIAAVLVIGWTASAVAQSKPVRLVFTGTRDYKAVRPVLNQIRQDTGCEIIPAELSPGLLVYKINCAGEVPDLVDVIKGAAVDQYSVETKGGEGWLEVNLKKM